MAINDRVSRGRQSAPIRLAVYGLAGIGKSTFAAGAPSPLFFDIEQRTGHLDVARVQPTSWDEVISLLRELHADPGEFKTLVVDTLDHLDALIHASVCKKNGWATIEDPGFGKGYVPALAEWGRFVAATEALRAKGVSTIMLAHGHTATVANALGENYDRLDLKLKGGAKTNPGDLIKEKADLVGCAHFEDFVKKVNKADIKGKAITTGERKLSFGYHPARFTKRGIPFPEEIELSWAAFEAALKQGESNA